MELLTRYHLIWTGLKLFAVKTVHSVHFSLRLAAMEKGTTYRVELCVAEDVCMEYTGIDDGVLCNNNIR